VNAPLLVALLLGQAPATPAAPPPQHRDVLHGVRQRDVLLVTLDTTRRDHMGFLGRTPSPTPNLDALAKESVVFTDAFTPVPLTLPAHTSLMTGLDPRSHGVHDNSLYQVAPNTRTLARIFGEQGYATRAAVASFVLDPLFGLGQGFDHYRAPPRSVSSRSAHFAELRADAMVDLALADLGELATPAASTPRRPFLYWLHLFDPHNPYSPPDAPPVTAADAQDPLALQRRLYEAEIRFADAQFGRLAEKLRERKLFDDLVVVVAADHGESLTDGLEETHGHFLFEPTIRVPLLMRLPGRAHEEVALPVSLVDVAPTLLAQVGLDARAERFDGLDLSPWIADPTLAPPDRVLPLESWYVWLQYGFAPLEGCVAGPLEYVRSHGQELFERGGDALHRRNLFASDDPRSIAIARRLDAIDAAARAATSSRPALSDADHRALASLGYANGGSNADAPAVDWSALPDPYAKLAVYAGFSAASSAIEAGDYDGAIAKLRELAAAEPTSALFHEQLGMMLANVGRHGDEAQKELKQTLALDPRRGRVWLALAHCVSLERDAIRAKLRDARAAAPKGAATSPEVRRLAASERDAAARVETDLRECLRLEPDSPDALVLLGRHLSDEGDRAAQQKDVERARRCYDEVVTLVDRLLAVLPNDAPERKDAAAVKARCVQRRAALER
jgi:Flp pilus assembly protein TadD